jgi:hypothetical protein
MEFPKFEAGETSARIPNPRIPRICVATVDTLPFSEMATVQEPPKRIISARILARRLEISPNALSKHIRRELVKPDYESDSGSFFDPSRLPQLKRTIAENRQRNWRHMNVAA